MNEELLKKYTRIILRILAIIFFLNGYRLLYLMEVKNITDINVFEFTNVFIVVLLSAVILIAVIIKIVRWSYDE